MEQHLTCEVCKLRYNLSTREPLLISCCDETVCRACWGKAFNVNGMFECPFKCGEANSENPQQSRISKIAQKQVRKCPPIDIVCDTHPEVDVTGYSQSFKKFVCSKCPDHKKDVIPINREKAEHVYAKIVSLLQDRQA